MTANQIRAGEVATPEESRYTSALDRILGRQAREVNAAGQGNSTGAVDLQVSIADGWLGQLSIATGDAADPHYQTRSRNGRRASDKGLLELTLDHYLDLLEWTGRQVCDNKSGVIPSHLASILERLKIRGDHWLDLIENFDRWFCNFVGHIDRLQQAAARSGRRAAWVVWVRHHQPNVVQLVQFASTSVNKVCVFLDFFSLLSFQKAELDPALLSPWPISRLPRWVERVNEPLTDGELAALRTSAKRGSPYGTASWIESSVKRLGLESTLRPRGRPQVHFPEQYHNNES